MRTHRGPLVRDVEGSPARGNYAEAEALHQRALAIRERTLGLTTRTWPPPWRTTPRCLWKRDAQLRPRSSSDCFTEGFDTADLKDAKALMDDLS